MVSAQQPLGRSQSLGWAASAIDLAFRLRALIVLFVLIVVFSGLSPSFLSPENLVIMSKHVAINAIIAIGVTFTILAGGIDLSVGSIAGLAGIVAGGLIAQGLVLEPLGVAVFFHPVVIVGIALLVGLLVGLVNGLIITRLGVAPFIATLGMLYVARGATLLYSNGATFSQLGGSASRSNTGFEWIGIGQIAGIPVPIWLMVVFAVGAWFIAAKTPFGRRVYAVGGNERAAGLSGIPVNRVKVAVYMIAGVCAAMAGLIIASQLEAAHPAAGETFELNAIAAVVLGGASLSGGRGTIGGTIVGAFVIGFLNDGLVILGVSSFWQMVAKGVVIILAVVVDQLQVRLEGRRALKVI